MTMNAAKAKGIIREALKDKNLLAHRVEALTMRVAFVDVGCETLEEWDELGSHDTFEKAKKFVLELLPNLI